MLSCNFLRASSRRLGAITLLTAILSCGATAEEIKIGGTGNAMGTIRLLGAAFSKKYPDTKVIVLGGLGSSGAVRAVPQGAIDLGISARVLTEDERKAGLVEAEYARTVAVFAVSSKSNVVGLSLDQVADIYSGKLIKWPDGTTIRPVLRQPGDDTTKQLRGLSPTISQALTQAAQRPGLPFAVIDQEAADKIESIPGAFGVTTLARIKSEDRALKALRVGKVEPTLKNGISGDYPLVKRFYFVTKDTQSPSVQRFLDFVKTPAGRDVLVSNGHWIP